MKYMNVNKFENETIKEAEMLSEKSMQALTLDETAFVAGGTGDDGDDGSQPQQPESETSTTSRPVSRHQKRVNKREALRRIAQILQNS